MKKIKLVVSDFDGIFTNGKLMVFSDGKTAKQIDYKDIMAIAILLKKGIKFAIISGEESKAIDVLKEKFPSIEVFQNVRKKINLLKELTEKYNISPENTMYIGDDINDEDCLRYVSYPVTTIDAHSKVKNIEGIRITKAQGGSGAFREAADSIE